MKENIVAAGVPAAKIIVAPNAVGGDYLHCALGKPLRPAANWAWSRTSDHRNG